MNRLAQLQTVVDSLELIRASKGNPNHKASGEGGGQFTSGGGTSKPHGKNFAKRQRAKKKKLEKLRKEGHDKFAKLREGHKAERESLRQKQRGEGKSDAHAGERKSLRDKHAVERQTALKGHIEQVHAEVEKWKSHEPLVKTKTTTKEFPEVAVRMPYLGPRDEEAIRTITKGMFGKEVSPQSLANISGSTEGSTVTIIPEVAANRIRVITRNEHYASTRVITKEPDGSVSLKADSFFLNEGIAKGNGIGGQVFGRMIENSRDHGISRINVEAYRDEDANGYYTWPRFGYDGAIPDQKKSVLPADLKAAEKLSDLMATDKGRQWWKKHGETVNLSFDLSQSSQSSQRWDAYRAEKRKAGDGTTMRSVHSTMMTSRSQIGPGSNYREQMQTRQYAERDLELFAISTLVRINAELDRLGVE